MALQSIVVNVTLPTPSPVVVEVDQRPSPARSLILGEGEPFFGSCQVEQVACIGTVTDGINVIVTITGAHGRGVVMNVGVTTGDTPDVWLAKIVDQGAISEDYWFYADGTNLVVVPKIPGSFPGMNVAISDPNHSGITPSPTSTTLLPGWDPDPGPPYLRVMDGVLYVLDAGLWKKTELSPGYIFGP
jgi:hypothetical protein